MFDFQVEVHQMTDGILLLSIDGLTHTTYMQDLPDQVKNWELELLHYFYFVLQIPILTDL